LFGFAASAALVAACGSSGSSPASPGDNGKAADAQNSAGANQAVSAHRLSGIGTVLVTSSGMTLYTPQTPTEANGNIKCTGSCLSFWIPVSASSATPDSAGLPGKLSTIKLTDGKTQLTYNGLPLYTFRLDTAAGQVHGNNFHDSFNGVNFTWQVVTANGKPAGTGSQAPAPSYSYQSGY
jgi:predicted lipoprotein with Yx(FWY)xxD motif